MQGEKQWKKNESKTSSDRLLQKHKTEYDLEEMKLPDSVQAALSISPDNSPEVYRGLLQPTRKPQGLRHPLSLREADKLPSKQKQ